MLKDLRPMLVSSDIERSISFYTEVLGFECVGDWDVEGVKVWCSLCRDGVNLMFTAAEPAHTHDDGSFHEAQEPALAGSLYFDCDEVDDLFTSLPSSVRVAWPPTDQEYGNRDFGIHDPDGYLLIFGVELPAPTA